MASLPESAKDLFDKKLPAALTAHPDKAKEIGAVYCFKITGDEGGTWTVDLAATPPTCTTGEHGTPQCTIEVSHSDFMSMLGNPALGMQLYFGGKLKVVGDPMLATKLQKLIAISE